MSLGRKKKSHSNHVSHPDEKWLVSYSDMMTLLFGFFVLMYALAAESPKGANAALAEIADAMAGKPKDAAAPPPPPPITMAKITEEELQKLKDRLAELEKLLQERQVELETVQKKNEELAQEKPPELTIDPEEFEALKKKVTELSSEIKKKNAEIAELKKKLEEVKTNNFMMIFTKWDTEKHDLDLTVKTPSGKIYSYKNRKFNDLPGELVLDSRYGPGAEIWNTNSLVPGDYEINVTLYNQYGNMNDAVVETGIVSSLSNVKLPNIKLNQKTKPSVTYRFNIDNEGRINLKSQ